MLGRAPHVCATLLLALGAPGATHAAPDGGVGRDAATAARAPHRDASAQPDTGAGRFAPDAASDGDGARGDAVEAPASAPALPPWAPKLSATVKPVVVALGDPVTVTIKLTGPKDVSAALPLRLELGQLSELARKESTRELGPQGAERREQTFVLEVAAYELGEVTLPPIEVTVLGPQGELLSLHTEAMPLKIKSLLANEPKPALKALAPVVSVFQRDWLLLYVLVGLGAAGLIVLATLVISRRLRARREAAKPPPPPVPAHVIALRRLAALDVERHIAEERFKELYFALSEIIRGYVGGRFGFDALEMTTAEIRATLTALHVGAEIRARVDDLLADWDLVKFAKVRPQEVAARAAHGAAESLVRETMLQEIAAAAAGPSAAPPAPPPREAGAPPAEADAAEDR